MDDADALAGAVQGCDQEGPAPLRHRALERNGGGALSVIELKSRAAARIEHQAPADAALDRAAAEDRLRGILVEPSRRNDGSHGDAVFGGPADRALDHAERAAIDELLASGIAAVDRSGDGLRFESWPVRTVIAADQADNLRLIRIGAAFAAHLEGDGLAGPHREAIGIADDLQHALKPRTALSRSGHASAA